MAYIDSLQKLWLTGEAASRRKLVCLALVFNAFILLQRLLRLRERPLKSGAPTVYVNVSHENLTQPKVIGRFAHINRAKIVLFVHDLIPLLYPEYARPGQADTHRARMETVLALADAILVNSAATKDAILRHAGSRSVPPIQVLPLGVRHTLPRPGEGQGAPYFVCLGTIEPRKNHLLLLHLWRSFAGAPRPRLLVIGRRGWENEMVLDMLERCPELAGHVEERAHVSDAALAALLTGACALLMPSFAEGYGLPVSEALSLGTPVICSDLPALREAGEDVPEYFDPLDGAAWRQAIMDYSSTGSPRRLAQIERLRQWRAPAWSDHFSGFDQVIAALAKQA